MRRFLCEGHYSRCRSVTAKHTLAWSFGHRRNRKQEGMTPRRVEKGGGEPTFPSPDSRCTGKPGRRARSPLLLWISLVLNLLSTIALFVQENTPHTNRDWGPTTHQTETGIWVGGQWQGDRRKEEFKNKTATRQMDGQQSKGTQGMCIDYGWRRGMWTKLRI